MVRIKGQHIYPKFICQHCGKEFEDKWWIKNRKFCSCKCRQASGVSVNTGKTRFKDGNTPWNKGKPNKYLQELWDDSIRKEKQIKKILKGLQNKPTSFEKKLIEMCKEYNLPYLYVGDGDFLVGHKNPDFINLKNKIAIEVFYSYFKIKVYGSVNNYKKYCKNIYEKFGWTVIFIDENDLKDDNVCLKLLKGGNILKYEKTK